jgi:streptogramin lyase
MRKAGLVAVLAVGVTAFTAAPTLAKKGDLIVTTYDDNRVLRVDPSGGSVDEIRSGPPMDNASYTAFEPGGTLAASDHGLDELFRIIPGNGATTQLTNGVSGDAGLDRAANGDFVVAEDAGSIERVDRKTGEASTLASGAPLSAPWGLDATPSGKVFVADEDGLIIRVSRSGEQSVVASSSDSLLQRPNDVVADPRGTLFVADDGADGVFRVNPKTGDVSTVASGLGDSYGVAVAPNGLIYATDYEAETVNRIDPKTGDVTVIADAADGIVSPLGIEVEPPKCKGKLATIVGSTNRDKLKGSKFKDVIHTLGGKDKVSAKGGNDIVCGGKGKDKLKGGGGKDKLLGQGGKDKLDGGPGKDKEQQ